MEKHIYKKVCKYCGKKFETYSNRQQYCGEDYATCVICGKPFKIREMCNIPKTCSAKCKQKQIEATCLEKYGSISSVNSKHGREKAKQTCLEKYGVEYYTQTDEYKERMTATCLERFGVKSPLQNDTIKEKLRATNQQRYGGNSPMCDETIKRKVRETVTERYGGFTFQSEVLSEKVKKTMLARYGVEDSRRSKEIQMKARETMLQRYGVANPMKSPEIRAKGVQTSLGRYGVEHPSQSDKVKSKVKQTVEQNYGVSNVFKSEEIKEKIRQVNLERYGCENPMQNAEIQDKSKQTCLERYGHENYRGSDVGVSASISDPTKFEQFKSFKSDPREFILKHYEDSPTLQKLSDDCGVDIATISNYVVRNHCQELVSYRPLLLELQVIEFLSEVDPNIQIKRHDRDIITPYEIDIYLPEYKIGFECNPTVTHNSSFADPWGMKTKSYKYHQMKSQLAQEQGVFLFHIFGYEWSNRRDVLKSMIRNLLGKNANKIYARDTQVVTISHKECEAFLNENHRQGATYSKVYLGLKHRDDLVAVMTFNHLRNTIGRTKDCDDTTWELSRFCGKANTSIIGGASKLFKHFVTTYSPKRIISFSDVAHTKGNLYSTLGFKQVSVSAPSYVWVNVATDKYFNRVTCQKNNLRKLFSDPTIDIEHHTEREIMESRGFAQVFDSGVIKWKFEPLISV